MFIITGNHKLAGHYARTGQKPDSPPEIVLTEPTETGRGNFCLSCWTLKDFTLTLNGGNLRRMFYRQHEAESFQPLDPANLPTNVINTAGKYKDIVYTHRGKAQHPLAAKILADLEASAKQDALDAWVFACEQILADPSLTEAGWKQKQTAWKNKAAEFSAREGKINLIDPENALTRLSDALFESGGFEAIAAAVRQKPQIETWLGQETEVVEELS
jgi:hypothetical protein